MRANVQATTTYNYICSTFRNVIARCKILIGILMKRWMALSSREVFILHMVETERRLRVWWAREGIPSSCLGIGRDPSFDSEWHQPGLLVVSISNSWHSSKFIRCHPRI